MSLDPSQEKALLTEILDPEIADNPFAAVMFFFPWGKSGTPLEKFEGPRQWQKDELLQIRDHIGENKERERKGDPFQVYQSATASGRGVGKSALTSWLIWWMTSTRLGSTTIAAANSEPQLKTRTWAELGRWHTLAINRHWFDRASLSLRPMSWLGESLKNQLGIDTTYWYANGTLWTEESPDAFAGVHNHHGEMVIFDEASGIPKPIWTVTDGFFTEPIADRYWFAFSNPRRNTGAFFDCFHADKEFWRVRNLDSRTVEGTDRTKLDQIVKKHGADSDEARIEVFGQFPQTGDRQFISREVVEAAVEREAELLFDADAPLILGVDPARFGQDSCTIRWRQGRVARAPFVPAAEKYKGKDNMFIADRVAYLANKHKPDAIIVDAGSGTGIIDRLRQRGFKVHEVWFGSSAEDSDAYANKRTEIWGRMKDWLEGAAIDGDTDLRHDLTAPEYKYTGSSDRKMLESKDEMKKRGIKSPDDGDALAVTFAVTVALRRQRFSRGTGERVARDVDYPIFG